MYKVVTSLLNPGTNNLTIALDEHQNIYRRKQVWKELGIQAKGRTHRLSNFYRNTREIHEFARKFIAGNDLLPDGQETQSSLLFPDLYASHGPKPEIRQFQTMEEIIESVAECIKKWIDAHVCACSGIAILYTVKSIGTNPGDYIPQRFGEALERRGILYNWVSQDYRSKKSYDITIDSVTISTIYSAKGFDYSRVFLIGLDHIDPGKLSEDQVRSLVYVGITRARYELFIPYVTNTDLIRRLWNCL